MKVWSPTLRLTVPAILERLTAETERERERRANGRVRNITVIARQVRSPLPPSQASLAV